ncbi:MAG TPA: OmpA family protein [Polyangia bacterium]|nr:OmpA family protein [Polyangia bacterium]
MRDLVTMTITALVLAVGPAAALAAPAPAAESNDFVLHDTGKAKDARGAKASKIEPTKTEAAMRFVVIDKEKGPVKGVVISMTAPDGTTYYTDETDGDGYAEVLVPVGKKYEVTYLSLGRKGDIAATVSVTDEPKQNVKLTLRYKRQPPPPPFVLKGVTFDTARATIRPESYPLLDTVAEFMAHRKSARVEISGHTDNVGNARANKALSLRRAQACRNYIIAKGIDLGRLEAIGYGDERPMVPNDSDDNRQKNRRIEARELQPAAQ